VYYIDEEVAGIDESKLALFVYDEINKRWDVAEDGGVDTINNYVWMRATHFTTTGIAMGVVTYGFETYADVASQTVKLGEVAIYKIKIEVTGSGSDTIQFTILNVPQKWYAVLTETKYTNSKAVDKLGVFGGGGVPYYVYLKVAPVIVSGDLDSDGLSNSQEDVNSNGLRDATETCMLSSDTDGDELPDGWIDSDKDGIKDLGEYEDRNMNGVVDTGDWNNGNGPGETNPLNRDTDGDNLLDNSEMTKWGITITRGDGSTYSYDVWSDPLRKDTDGDGLSDLYESWGYYDEVTGTRSRADPTKYDTDNDGLSDAVELSSLSTNDPTKRWAVSIEGMYKNGGISYYTTSWWVESNPAKVDTDGDGLTDLEEYRSGSIPSSNRIMKGYSTSDSDGDGLTDAQEVHGWTVDSTKYTSYPNTVDTDHDGLTDKEEYDAKTNPMWESGKDTDSDGINDLDETTIYRTYVKSVWTNFPLHSPTTIIVTPPTKTKYYSYKICFTALGGTSAKVKIFLWDYLYDVVSTFPADYTTYTGFSTGSSYQIKIQKEGDVTFSNIELFAMTNPTVADTDGDGLKDGEEIATTLGTSPVNSDSDLDGLSDKDEINYYRLDGDKKYTAFTGTNPTTADTNPIYSDTDGDSLTDGEEVNYYKGDGNNIYTQGWDTNPLKKDTDGDGLTDSEEKNLPTRPIDPDSDDDGLYDGWKDNDGDCVWDEGERYGEIGDPGNTDAQGRNKGSIAILINNPAENPRPYVKDIYVEVDWMEECAVMPHEMTLNARNKVVSAFISHGIVLHIDAGIMGGGGVVPHNNPTYMPLPRDSSIRKPGSMDDFYDYKWGGDRNHNGIIDGTESGSVGYFDYRRAGIFHYAMFAHQEKEMRDNTPHWGAADEYNDIIVSDGDMRMWDAAFLIGSNSATVQAGMFMHELGHNLGLIYDPDGNGVENTDPFGTKTVMNYWFIISYVDYDTSEWETINLTPVTQID
jgi:hypothetical protein